MTADLSKASQLLVLERMADDEEEEEEEEEEEKEEEKASGEGSRDL